jgi:hypothetical protein
VLAETFIRQFSDERNRARAPQRGAARPRSQAWQRVLDQYREYFNSARPHQGMTQRRPIAFAQEARAVTAAPVQTIVARPVLDGLHHDYRSAK